MFTEGGSFFGLGEQLFVMQRELAVKDVSFIFNKQIISQKDGVLMGNPLGPTLANIFLRYHKEIWQKNCSLDLKPVFYQKAYK